MTSIANGESGSSVRSKLNASLTVTDAFTVSNGNVGIGVTPSAWSSVFEIIELGGYPNPTTALGNTSGGSYFSFNTYYNTSSQFVYKATQTAAYYAIESNVHKWNIAPSGAADTAITFTQAMTLTAAGRLGIGTTSPSYELDVVGSIRNDGYFINKSGGTIVTLFANDGGSSTINATGGSVGIGTASPNAASIVDAQSTTKGVRFPNMTTTQ